MYITIVIVHVTAIKRLKNNKSPGVCNILPEMLKYGGDSVHSALYRVILGIWRTEQAPQDFKQDILLPIPKKGDASLCSNYRTIALARTPIPLVLQFISGRLIEANCAADEWSLLHVTCLIAALQ